MLMRRLFTSAACYSPDEPAAAATPAENLYPEAAAETPAPEAEAEAASEEPKAEPEAEAAPEGEAEAESEALPLEIKIPEGFEANAEQLAEFQSLAKEAGVTGEQAQKLADLYFQGLSSLAEANAKAFSDTVDAWKAELYALPDFATDDKRTAAQTLIGRALDEYGSPQAREAFDASGIGWNPHVVSMFHKMAQALSEGGPVGHGRPAPKTTLPHERLYPSS